MAKPKFSLNYRITKINAHGPTKTVQVQWYETEGSSEHVWLQDSVGVPPKATDDEIIAMLDKRRPQIEADFENEKADADMNSALIGRESRAE